MCKSRRWPVVANVQGLKAADRRILEYHTTETIPDLIPHMLDTFIRNHRGFKKTKWRSIRSHLKNENVYGNHANVSQKPSLIYWRKFAIDKASNSFHVFFMN